MPPVMPDDSGTRPNVNFRVATPADAEALLALGRRTVIDTFAHHNDPAHFARFLEEHYTIAKFAADLADPAAVVLVGEDDAGAMIAFARLRLRDPAPACIAGPRAIEIEKFYVDKPYLGRGVGPAMMRRCLGEARRLGRRTVFLGVWEHNTRAVRFYEKWGFRRVGEVTFMVGGDPQIDWVMVREV